MHEGSSKWPKTFPAESTERQRIRDDFLKYWLEVLPRRYGIVDRFSHRYVVEHAPERFTRTLEIGAGLGEHLEYEKLNAVQERNYFALELRESLATEIRRRFPNVQVYVGDCQTQLNLPDSSFDRILAVHVLEHLPNLPATIREMYRLLDKEHGIFSVVIPCEGNMAYTLARRISAQRIFEQRYRQSYKWFIEREHVNKPDEILEETTRFFNVVHRRFFPTVLPVAAFNLCIGVTLKPKG